VNESLEDFAVSEGAIRFGMGAVKGIGSGPIEAIVETREEDRYESLFDFCERVPHDRCPKSVIEPLVRCGAFDSTWETDDDGETSLLVIGERRAKMLAALDAAVGRGQRKQEDLAAGQSSLFDAFAAQKDDEDEGDFAEFPEVPGWHDRQVLENERDILGFFVSGHPLDRYVQEVKLYADTYTVDVAEREHNEPVRIAGVISSTKVIDVKDGTKRMAFLTFEDKLGETELVFFPSTYEKYVDFLERSDPMIVTGKIRVRDRGDSTQRNVAVDKIVPLAQAREENVKHVTIEMDPSQVQNGTLNQLQTLFADEVGDCRVTLRVRHISGDAWFDLPSEVGLSANEHTIRAVEKLIGDKRIRLS
jgi:DNA polymerase-3 subunit alpha